MIFVYLGFWIIVIIVLFLCKMKSHKKKFPVTKETPAHKPKHSDAADENDNFPQVDPPSPVMGLIRPRDPDDLPTSSDDNDNFVRVDRDKIPLGGIPAPPKPPKMQFFKQPPEL